MSDPPTPLILVVEDEVRVAEVIAVLTESNYETRVALTAADALTIAEMDRPDAILLDINLPDASGTTMLDRLRALRPNVPIIMIAANADEELARETLRHGAFDYLMKPFNLDRLMHVVKLRWRHGDDAKLKPRSTASRFGPASGR